MIPQLARKYWFPVLVIGVHLLFFLLARHFKHIYNGDSFEYIYEAVNIKDQGFFYSGNPALPITEEYMTFRQPLYPLFLLLVYLFTINNWLVLILQNIISIGNIFLLRQTLIQIGYKEKYDWLLATLLLAFPAQFIHANTIEPEILLQSTVCLYFYSLVRFAQSRSLRYVLFMSLALVAGLLIKPVLYPFTWVHLLLIGVLVFRWKTAKLPAITISALPIVVVMLYNTWNLERTGKFHFSSNQSFNAIYYFYFYKANNEGIAEAKQFLKRERDTISTMPAFKDRYDYAQTKGKVLLKENFVSYSLYHLQHSMWYFFDPGKGGIDLFTGRLSYGSLYTAENAGIRVQISNNGLLKGSFNYIKQYPLTIVLLIVLAGNIIKIIGVALLMRQKEIAGSVRIIALLLFIYFAAVTGPISTPRYVMPISLLLIGCAVVGWQLTRKDSNIS